MRRRISRRALVGFAAAASIFPLVVKAQYQLTPEVVSIASPRPNASIPATPTSTPQAFRGELRAIWDEPWEVEGRTVTFKCIVVQKLIADDGTAIRVGEAGDYQALLRVDIPREGTLWVASNIDPKPLEDRKTIEVQGTYGGVFGPGWTEPVIIANRWGPAT
jgi:hypothetical protein